MSRVSHKKIYTVSENTQSIGLGEYSKKKKLQGRKLTKKFHKGKTKSDLYYRG